MPLMRIIFESGQLWYKLGEGFVRSFFVPLTLINLIFCWFVEDIYTAYKIFYSLCSELLHIFPCVLGQIGIIDYEPIREIIEKRNNEIEAEKNFYMKIYKRVVIKYATGIRIIRNHSSMVFERIYGSFDVWEVRYRQILRLWFLSKDTKDYYLHYPKCFIKVILIRLSLYTPKKEREANFKKKKKNTKVSLSLSKKPALKKSNLNLKAKKVNLSKTKETSSVASIHEINDAMKPKDPACPFFYDDNQRSGITESSIDSIQSAFKHDAEEDKENEIDPTLKKYKLSSPQLDGSSEIRKQKSRRLSGISTLPPTTVEFPTDNTCEYAVATENQKSDVNHEETTSLPTNGLHIKVTPPNSPSRNGFSTNSSPLKSPKTESFDSKNSPKRASQMKKIPITMFRPFTSKKYYKVKKAIIQAMDRKDFDDGSMGPIFVRLCWHCCATYDKETGTGGSNGATIRLAPESIDEGNNGLMPAKEALEPVKAKFQWISYADLYTLAGVVAIEAMGGPKIQWIPGRTDTTEGMFVPPNGRLPLGDGDSQHIKEIFFRMGFNIQETVCLMGTHTLGRTHLYYSGWEGKWSNDPIRFDNEFFKLLLNSEWEYGEIPETGRRQFFDKSNREIMMLNTDMEMVTCQEFRVWAEIYANDEKLFFEDYAKVFAKLLELGVERNKEGIAIKTR